MNIRQKVPESKHIDGNYDNGLIHHTMKAFSDNPLSPLIGISQASTEDISSKIAPNCIETYSNNHAVHIKSNSIQYTDTYLKPPMSRWLDLDRHVLPVRHVRCEWARLWWTKEKLKYLCQGAAEIMIWNGHLMKNGHYPSCNITNDRSDVHAKGQDQRSKVKLSEVNTQLSRFQNVTPVWLYTWWWNDAQSLMLLRRGVLLLFKVMRQISRSHS